MKDANKNERIISIDLRTSRFGFVVFEGPTCLLDWGVKNFRHGVNAVRIPANVKFGRLMERFLPNAILILTRDVETKGRAGLRESLQTEAEKRRISVHRIHPLAVKDAFAGSSRNKYEIASAVIKQFPELASRRPSQRKIWKPEDYVIQIFNAAALGVTHFTSHSNNRDAIAPPPHEA